MDIIEKIKWLEDEVMEEVQGAKAYMRCSNEWKNTDPEISKTFHHMALQEMSHAEQLNQMVLKILNGHMEEIDLKRLPELMSTINKEQINAAKSYIPDAEPEVTVRKA